MNLIQNPTVISPAESVVARISERAAEELTNLKSATVASFLDFWEDPETVADKLAVMGTKAVASFQQHARTVQFLLESGIEMDPSEYTPPIAYTPHEDGTITLDAP